MECSGYDQILCKKLFISLSFSLLATNGAQQYDNTKINLLMNDVI